MNMRRYMRLFHELSVRERVYKAYTKIRVICDEGVTEMTLTAVVQREENLFVAQCPELGVVSQGTSRMGAIASLREGVEGLL